MSKLKLAIMLMDEQILELSALDAVNETGDGDFVVFTDRDGTVLTVKKDMISYYKVFEYEK